MKSKSKYSLDEMSKKKVILFELNEDSLFIKDGILHYGKYSDNKFINLILDEVTLITGVNILELRSYTYEVSLIVKTILENIRFDLLKSYKKNIDNEKLKEFIYNLRWYFQFFSNFSINLYPSEDKKVEIITDLLNNVDSLIVFLSNSPKELNKEKYINKLTNSVNILKELVKEV